MNKENRTQVILAGALGVVLVGVLFYQFVLNKGPAPIPSSAVPPPPSATASTAGKASSPGTVAQALRKVDIDITQLIQEVQQVNFDYMAAQTDRDPMDPLVGSMLIAAPEVGDQISTTTLTEIRRKKVTGIVYDGVDSVAIVDDELVSVGHEYDNGIMVYEIDSRRVTFKVGDTLIPVEMKEL